MDTNSINDNESFPLVASPPKPPQPSTLGAFLTIYSVIEIITCKGSTKGANGYCGPAVINEQIARWVKTIEGYDKEFVVEGPFSPKNPCEGVDNVWGYRFYVLWHLNEWRDREHIRAERVRKNNEERQQRLEQMELRELAVERMHKAHLKVSHNRADIEKTRDAFNFLEAQALNGDKMSADMLRKFGYEVVK